MEIIILVLSIVAVVIAYFQLMVPISKGEVVIKKKFPFIFRPDSTSISKDDYFESYLKPRYEKLTNAERILSYIWYFPLGKGNQVSWAVKESQILLGNLVKARESPGLGIAVFSVEFGLDIFGQLSFERIENCISWALIKTQKEAPFLLQVELTDPITTKKEIKTDFRHTLALSIVLSKSRQKPTYLIEYVKLALELQEDDGGWPPGSGDTVSEVFTVLYALELLLLNQNNNLLDNNTRRKINPSIEKSIDWLITNLNKEFLWESGVLKDYAWDPLLATSWVIRRLLSLHLEQFNKEWLHKINLAAQALVKLTTENSTWIKSDDLQKFRVESRVASAIYECLKEKYYDDISVELFNAYLKDWKRRTNSFLTNLQFDDFDLSTALFLAKPLIGYENFSKIKDKILAMLNS
jgi:hypothetical protein